MRYAAPQPVIPLDPPKDALAEIQIPGTELIALIRDAISTVQKLPTTGENSLVDGKPCASKSLLALLTYCYAQGVYGSRQIEERIRSDGTLRAASAGCLPDHQLLSRFRRRHRGEILYCLRRVYWFIWVKYGIQRREFKLAIDSAPGKRVRVSSRFSEKVDAE